MLPVRLVSNLFRVAGRKEIGEAVLTAALVTAVTWGVNNLLEKIKEKKKKLKKRKK